MMKLITITGPSGAGKDTAARILSELTGIPVLVSYTTRPMREGEVNGREHIFVSHCTTSRDQMLGYTVYGGYEYWTEVSQLKQPPAASAFSEFSRACAIYVIDEPGLIYLHDRFPHIHLITIHVTANEEVRKHRGITYERMRRDLERISLPIEYYDYRISNNHSIADLRATLQAVADTLPQH